MFTNLLGGADHDAAAHFARISPSDVTIYAHLHELIVSLKQHGIWPQIEVLCVAHDNEADSLLNLTGGTDSTKTGTPTFVANTGFECVAGTDVIDLNIAMSSASLYDTDDHHLINYVTNTTVGSNTTALYSFDSGAPFGFQNEGIIRAGSTSVSFYNLGVSLSVSVGGAAGSAEKGFLGMCATTASARAARVNDTENTGVATSGSTKLTTNFICKGGDTGSADQTHHACWGIGGPLTATQLGLYENAIRKYAQARGFDVY